MTRLILTLVLVVVQAGSTETAQCKLTYCLQSNSYCDGYWCNRCQDGYYLDTTSITWRHYCTPCPDSCSYCDGYKECSGCNAGYYGSLCDSVCTSCYNNICQQNSGACTYGCVSGYYKETDDTCSQCPTGCSQCTSSYSCSSCNNANNWGATCQYTCDNCKSAHCSKANGCLSGCYDSYYSEYNSNKRGYECKQCRWSCTSCTKYDTCQSCRSGYWGTACQNTCGQCSSCNKYDGCSSGCNDRYYMQYSSTKGGYECKWCNYGTTCTAVCKSGYFGTLCQTKCPTNCYECTSDTACSRCVVGYWGNYCQHSCSACLHSVCSKDQGCTDGCINGYYRTENDNQIICEKCLSACKTCFDDISCSSCPSGYNGTKCQFDCTSCNGGLCSSTTGECTYTCASDEYFKMDYSGQVCFKCPGNCSSCYSAYQCTTCFDGYFGYLCSSKCLSTCKSCINGYSCDSCAPGYFNRQNNNKCECNKNKCFRRDGNICQICSDNTWYPDSDGCCPCSTNCKDNVCSTDSTCVDCSDTKYGSHCERTCRYYCKDSLCYQNGSCISCKNEYLFGPTCGLRCRDSIPRCGTCYGLSSDTVTCTSCWNGWYADNDKCTACSSHCISTTNTTCDPSTGKCKGTCEHGWFGDRCDIDCNVTNCQTCSNEDQNICNECKNGYYGVGNYSCVACPDNCIVDTICDKRNGSCIEGCEEKWSGEQCEISCPYNCRECDQFNKSSCSLCKEDFYGDSCEHTCNEGCDTRNGSSTCNKINGTCNFDCKATFWSTKCERQCGTGCSGNICNRTNGHCLSQCLETHFGLMCDEQCSENCNTTVGRSCNETYGYCLNGCHVGWFGSQCNEACSKNCKEKICDRNNGSCISGCIDGYTGSKCMTALLKEDPGSNTAAIGGGAGAGVAVLVILAVIVVVIVLRRRKSSSKMETANGRSVEKKQSFNQNEPEGPVYSNINEGRIEKENTEIAGVTNIVYANTAVRMSDVSENDEVINVNITPARPTSVNYLDEVEMGDDNEEDNDEADVSGFVDDTYYNIGVQRVAVARLAEYIKNKSQEDLLNDFEKIPKGLLKSYNEAKKSKNATKNKYRAIYPYDENRVILLDGGSDYMNASYIDGYNRQKEYIASSGPFQKSYDTTSDFWRMIFQERCETLVMLTQPVENGQTKCTKYWPDADESCQYGEISITCLTEDVYADFTIRILAVTKGTETINIRHVHFTAWPDKGIPHDVTSMIELRQKVRSLHKDKESPIIVHCSAGIGRTGTFIVLDMLTFEGEDRGSVDIFGSVVSLRNQRCNMVQTPEQYVYLHHAVLHSLTFDCRSIPGDMFLQNYNKLIERNGGDRIIDKQFKQLQSISEEMTDEDREQIERNKVLPNKNRKGADVPADECRVKLHENRKPGASDYINAVYVNSFRRKQKFICAQTPLPSTVVDFLSLIHQERCTCIVSMEEPDINDKTMRIYWPADNQIVKHGVFSVSCKDSKTTAHYVSKILSVTYHGPNGEETRDANLFIFTNWPKDSPVPKSSDSLLELVKTVDPINRTPGYEVPILIHCRTGAERSCLYCAVSVLIEKMEIEHEVSVVNTLRQIKARRLSAISSVEQYKFCHQAVINYLQSFDIYSNFGLKEADAY